ncbi:PaaX domain protein [Sulfitobacter noctilucae]|uniref:PaaX family transcriptional regulator C-terminal domain-containing protein n=1 Tax=Sulfitobacter noctilucae TaxID=1342302 RepID=UPI000468C850|nr:PaaX family transcriptional regulator C-terminal domain-containing protein [Sulfitobacter noctilucae]KIN65670.1 PaaX domain protein [Sulfitobacter noctilucae]
MDIEEFASLTAGLRSLGGQRVWSLVISLFGDLAQEPGQAIDGPVLSTIMAGLDVKPEAARVALHRLRNDGWITSEKSGRIRRHSLTAQGRRESAAASPRIYADATLTNGKWQIVLTEHAADLSQLGFTQITPRIFAGPRSAKAPAEAMILCAGAAPDWLRAQIADQRQQSGYADLLTALTALRGNLPSPTELPALHTAVLRCLVVHNWRRLVLRHPTLPAALIDPEGAPHRCHVAVADLLARYPRPSITEVEQSCATV